MLVVYSLVKSMEQMDSKFWMNQCPTQMPYWATHPAKQHTVPPLILSEWKLLEEILWRVLLPDEFVTFFSGTNIFLAKINTLLQINWFPYLKSQLVFSSPHLSWPPSRIFLSSEDAANFFWEKGNKMCVLIFFFFPSHPLLYLQCWGWGSFSFCSPLTPQSDLGSFIRSPYLPLWHLRPLWPLFFVSHYKHALCFSSLSKKPHTLAVVSVFFSISLVFLRANPA